MLRGRPKPRTAEEDQGAGKSSADPEGHVGLLHIPISHREWLLQPTHAPGGPGGHHVSVPSTALLKRKALKDRRETGTSPCTQPSRKVAQSRTESTKQGWALGSQDLTKVL